MTEGLLWFTTLLIGTLWFLAQRDAARKEFKEPAQQRNWIVASMLLFLVMLSFTLTAGGSGWLTDFSRFPPPFLAFFIYIWAAPMYVGFSRFGAALVKHTPLPYLIAFHAFRILAELIIWSAVRKGLAPVQLSFEGYQFDIITGVTAIPVAWWMARHPRSKLAAVWNAMGFFFLLVIGFIAATSMPTPSRLFEQDNLWVTSLPYTLLPGILVTAAIAGHVIIARKLWNNL